MTSAFISELAERARLTENEIAILAAIDVRSPDDVDGLLRGFPSLATIGVRFPVISNAVASRVSANYGRTLENVEREPRTVGFGAIPPEGARFSFQSEAETVTSAQQSSAASSISQLSNRISSGSGSAKIDLRLNPWPVRNQGDRGTCVAFGVTACTEHFDFTSKGGIYDLSEQFLYWAIKDHSYDPNKMRDGTLLRYAQSILGSDGICAEALWPYVPTPVNPVSGQTATAPSTSARIDAAVRRLPGMATGIWNPSNAAAQIIHLLGAGRPVAITVPVFKDKVSSDDITNWTTNVGWAYGRILNPPPTSIVDGGHCVCVTGFIPDQDEPTGGYFVFRNSWGTIWGEYAPTPGSSYSPQQGYGEISASYIDKYCWEILQI